MNGNKPVVAMPPLAPINVQGRARRASLIDNNNLGVAAAAAAVGAGVGAGTVVNPIPINGGQVPQSIVVAGPTPPKRLPSLTPRPPTAMAASSSTSSLHGNGPPRRVSIAIKAYSSFATAGLPPVPDPDKFWIFAFVDAPNYDDVSSHPAALWLNTIATDLGKDQYPLEASRVMRKSAATRPDATWEMWKGGRFLSYTNQERLDISLARQTMIPTSPVYEFAYVDNINSLIGELQSDAVKNGIVPHLVEIMYTSFPPLVKVCHTLSKALQANNTAAIVIFVDVSKETSETSVLKGESWASFMPAIKIYHWDAKGSQFEIGQRAFAFDEELINVAFAPASSSELTRAFVFRKLTSTGDVTNPKIKERRMSTHINLVQQYFTLDANDVNVELDQASLLGGGGFGAVYRGELMGLPIACKFILNATATNNTATTAALFDEAYMMGQLRHPNITQLIGLTIKHQKLCIVQELCSHSLTRWTNSASDDLPSIPHILKALREVACGLAFIHRQGLVHLDLKPDNLLHKKEANETKVADVGMMKLFDGSLAPIIARAHGGGTHLWLAPEVVRARFPSNDPNARWNRAAAVGVFVNSPSVDVFAFGMIAYCLLCVVTPDSQLQSRSAEELEAWAHGWSISKHMISYFEKMFAFAGADATRQAHIASIYTLCILQGAYLTSFSFLFVEGMPEKYRRFDGSRIELMPSGPGIQGELVEKLVKPCIRYMPHKRPAMIDVVDMLDSSMQKMKEAAASSSSSAVANGNDSILSPVPDESDGDLETLPA